MDYIGFSIYAKLLTGEKAMLDDLRIDTADEPETIFSRLFADVEWLASELESTFGQKKLGTCIHLCNLSGLFSNDFIMEPWLETLKDARKTMKYPFVTGFHINFDHNNLPLAPGFIKTFCHDMDLCTRLGVEAMVLHAPLITTNDTDRDWVNLMLDPSIIESMKSNNTILCWENAQDTPARYRSMEKLVKWREKMVDALERAGYPELVDRHLFCFDTGHFLLSLQRDGISHEEVDVFLPQFARHVKVFHIQCNDGTSDQHLVPFLDLDKYRNSSQKTRTVNHERFYKNSLHIIKYLDTCKENAGVDGQHVHLELDSPMPLEQMLNFFHKYYGKS